MFGLRRTLSGGTFVGAAVLALMVVASAPAASGQSSAARTFLTGAHARGQPARAVERMQAAAVTRVSAAEALGITQPRQLVEGKRRVVIEAADVARARASVEALGGRVERTAAGLVQALVDPADVGALQRSAGGRVRAPYVRMQHSVAGETVATTLAAAWHAKGFTGKGVKVAIIDGGFAGLAQRQADGDLPADAVTQDYCGGEFSAGEDHGTAVAEIVHEMAPEAQLYLVCVATDVDFAAAVAYAKSQGVQVINHSAGWEGPVPQRRQRPLQRTRGGCARERDPLGQLRRERG